MINVEPVTWTLAIAKAREGSIQAVAQPVDGQAEARAQQTVTVPAGGEVAKPGAQHPQQAEGGEVIRIDGRRRPRRQPEESFFLCARKQAILQAARLAKF